jgi:hypothetical protein
LVKKQNILLNKNNFKKKAKDSNYFEVGEASIYLSIYAKLNCEKSCHAGGKTKMK